MGEKKQSKNRKAKREILDNPQLLEEMCKIIQHYFPGFMQQLKQVIDPRNPSYITYPKELLLMLRIMAAVFAITSMRQISELFNHEICLKNTENIFHLDTLQEMPYWETINDFLKEVSAEELQEIIYQMAERLIRMRSFEQGRYRGTYWLIDVDGTHLHSFSKRHCSKCLTRERKLKDGSTVIEYYHAIVEAKLVLSNGVVISIASEPIENSDGKNDKQDCELKALYRLAEKLKKRFPRLPICLCMDALYANESVFELCQKNKWAYLIRFKEGSLPSVWSEYEMLKKLEDKEQMRFERDGILYEYAWVNKITYNERELNCAECKIGEKHFVYLSSLPIKDKNVEETIAAGRKRWSIENQGFNVQKNNDYAIEHLYSKAPKGLINHYLLIQIAHTIEQLIYMTMVKIHEIRISRKELRIKLREQFCYKLIREGIEESLKGVSRYRRGE